MKKIMVVWMSVFLLACSACGISQADYDAAVSDAWQEGCDVGKDVGYDEGYDEGYDDGLLEHRPERVFFRNYACIVTTSGSKYHHYGCYHIEGRSFYIYNIELAKSKGYTPCLDCWESGLINSLVLPGTPID